MNQINIKGLKALIPAYQIFQHNKDELSLVVSHQNLISVLKFLKLHINYQYNLLSCVSGVDLLGSKYRFCVVYDLLSIVNNSRIRIKVYVNEVTSLNSAVSVYHNANWWEREVWDMYGIYFQNHPDLRRILTDYGFEGYPLRKDFPLAGYLEVRYHSVKKVIVHEPVQMAQEFRSFIHEGQW
jgi:NADH/F420H2 dehydrogenase subunit C